MRGELPPCLPAGRDAVKLILRDGICYAEPADTTGVRGLCSVRVKMSQSSELSERDVIICSLPKE
jgi:hypothetical protein